MRPSGQKTEKFLPTKELTNPLFDPSSLGFIDLFAALSNTLLLKQRAIILMLN